MLSQPEKFLFLLLALFTLGAAGAAFADMFAIIRRGQGPLSLDRLPQRLLQMLQDTFLQRRTLRARPLTSLLHWGLVLGFSFYALVNVVDLLTGFLPDFPQRMKQLGPLYELFRLLADLLSAVVLLAALYFLVRRLFFAQREGLRHHSHVQLHPRVQAGAISDDSLVVLLFILLHVGARLLAESLLVAQTGADPAMPLASLLAGLWQGLNGEALQVLRQLCWWLAIGGILLFLPYFPQSKHAHLFMAPLNILTQPRRNTLATMQKLDFEDESIEQFGVARLEDLSQSQLLDGFACIMCNRCQDVCPAYVTGKELSPAALEINKRFAIKQHWDELASGVESTWLLREELMSESALWACTACGACIDICPVGNEPMMDILDMRRDAVLMQSSFPHALQGAFNGMERQGNPWQIADARSSWTAPLDFPVPTIQENPSYELLYWTGCAVNYDPRAQETARALVKVLYAAGLSFAILGDAETCTGDAARRAGNEYLFDELATRNVATLHAAQPKRIVVTCPHCLQTLGKEYGEYGGQFEVLHHSQLIAELIDQGRIPPSAHPAQWSNVTFHDPCYLGRHNGEYAAPRRALQATGIPLLEMPRNRSNSFCCGAGGAQFWKEEEPGTRAVNHERYAEATATGAQALAVGCPFCMRMLQDARAGNDAGPQVLDIAEIVAAGL